MYSSLQTLYNAMKKCSHLLRLVEFKDKGERTQMQMTFIEGTRTTESEGKQTRNSQRIDETRQRTRANTGFNTPVNTGAQ